MREKKKLVHKVTIDKKLIFEKRKVKIWFRFSVITSLASTFCGFVSSEENLSPRRRKRTMTTEEKLVVTVVLNALISDGAVVDSRPFPVVLDRLLAVEVG